MQIMCFMRFFIKKKKTNKVSITSKSSFENMAFLTVFDIVLVHISIVGKWAMT